MVRGQLKSRTFRRIKVKTPGGNVKVHYRLRKPSKAHCAACGVVLQAVPNERPVKMKHMAKSKKRPQRPFGGVLCAKCMKNHIITGVLFSEMVKKAPTGGEE